MRRIALLIAVLATRAAFAHDFWIEPSNFHPAIGETVSAGLRVGQQFTGDPVGRDSAAIEKFIVRDSAGERALVGMERRDPAGYFRVEHAGTAIVAYRSHPSYLEMPPEKFEQYLRDEGLERVIAERAKRGESQKPSREIYSRCVKSLIVTDRATDFTKPIGLRYEIIPLAITSDAIEARVVYESKPLAGALVIAMHQDDPSLRTSMRSDASGRVRFKLPKRGVWMIKSVQMIAAPPSSNADWESLWASLTFEE